MDIKLKNKFRPLALIISIFLTGISLLSVFDLTRNRSYLKENYYFSSNAFIYTAGNDFFTIGNLLTNFKDYPVNILNYKFSDAEIKNEMTSYDFNTESRIWNEYYETIQQAANSGDSEKMTQLIAERNTRLNQLLKKGSISVDEAKEKIIKERNNEYEKLKSNVKLGPDNIKYYFTDKNTKAVYTNMSSNINITDYIKKNALYSLKFPYNYTSYTFKSVSSMLYGSELEGYFIIPKSTDSYNSTIITDYNYYNSIRKRLIEEIWILAISIILVSVLSVFMHKYKDENDTFLRILRKHKRIPLDLRSILFITIVFVSVMFMKNANFFSLPINLRQVFIVILSAFYSLYVAVVVIDIIGYIRKPESIAYDFKNSLLGRFKSYFRNCLLYKGMITTTILLIIVTLLTGIMINKVGESFNYNRSIDIVFLLIIFILYFMTAFAYIIFKLGYLSKIVKGTSQMVSGDLDFSIEEHKGGMLGLLAHNINNMELGYKKTLDDKVKSERLKSELITNVSHDLKTPLTSIINYINFLKNDSINEGDKKSYLEILDRKSQRLKTLIEDLFEASKMASGSVKLEFQQVNLVELLKQALGEYDEKIKNSSLTFKVNGENQNILMTLDGKKTWRVFDNLINNALKYSQPGTRVYIDIIDEKSKSYVIIKNISAYELDFDPQEIFERFKRGDKSRNTEGSGLGLDIAKSIVELEGGRLSIEIDGDLFKAIVEFNKKIHPNENLQAI